MNTPQVKKYAGHVYLVDDDDSMRESLGVILKSHHYRVQEFASATEFLELHKLVTPSMLILDVRLPDHSGVELQSKLKEVAPNLPIVFISGHCKNTEIIEAFKSGAVDFLLKPFGMDQLLSAVAKGIQSSEMRNKHTAVIDNVLNRYSSLTPREKEVSDLLAQGLPNLEIAKMLDISPATVKIHKCRVLKKLHVTTETGLRKLYDDAVRYAEDINHPALRK